MNACKLFLLLCLLALLQTGCVGYQKPAPVYGGQSDYPVYDPYRYPDDDNQQPDRAWEPATRPESIVEPYQEARPEPEDRFEGRVQTPEQSSPAVIALLGQAETSSRAGQLESAAATIERARRIEPRNANLVYKLAEVRLQQGKARLAEDLAKRANLLSSGNHALKRRCWLLIAEARRQQGNRQGALEAEMKAGEY